MTNNFDAVVQGLDAELGRIEQMLFEELNDYREQYNRVLSAKRALEGEAERVRDDRHHDVYARRRAQTVDILTRIASTEPARIRRTDEEIVAILKDANAKGYTVRQTAALAGVTPLSIYHWKRKHPGLLLSRKQRNQQNYCQCVKMT